MFYLTAHQAAEVARERHGRGHPLHSQDRLHHLIGAQSLDVREAAPAG